MNWFRRKHEPEAPAFVSYADIDRTEYTSTMVCTTGSLEPFRTVVVEPVSIHSKTVDGFGKCRNCAAPRLEGYSCDYCGPSVEPNGERAYVETWFRDGLMATSTGGIGVWTTNSRGPR